MSLTFRMFLFCQSPNVGKHYLLYRAVNDLENETKKFFFNINKIDHNSEIKYGWFSFQREVMIFANSIRQFIVLEAEGNVFNFCPVSIYAWSIIQIELWYNARWKDGFGKVILD